jgi:hypothetical protein
MWIASNTDSCKFQVSGAPYKPNCFGLSFFRKRCECCRRCWNSSRVERGGGGLFQHGGRPPHFHTTVRDFFVWKFHGNGLAEMILTLDHLVPLTLLPPETFFWRYTEVAAYGPPLSTTLSELPRRARASTLTVTPVMPTELRTELEYGYDTVPSLNICKPLSLGHKIIITIIIIPTTTRSSLLCHFLSSETSIKIIYTG